MRDIAIAVRRSTINSVAQPWTMTELNKIDPVMVQRKIDAIKEVVIDSTLYKRGPLSLFGLSASSDKSRDAKMVTLPCQNFRGKLASGDRYTTMAREGVTDLGAVFNDPSMARLAPQATGAADPSGATGSSMFSVLGY
ncbi:hypothetical protein T492DRAFT_892224 [Pavlovales sp. CCMP2436]|nr:hypothetical protein T492DRAFT_892224 [Pavlovales sp. CCMP2436]